MQLRSFLRQKSDETDDLRLQIRRSARQRRASFGEATLGLRADSTEATTDNADAPSPAPHSLSRHSSAGSADGRTSRFGRGLGAWPAHEAGHDGSCSPGAGSARALDTPDCDGRSGRSAVAALQEELSAAAALLRARSEACRVLEVELQRAQADQAAARDEALGAAVRVAEVAETVRAKERTIAQLTEQVRAERRVPPCHW